MLNASGIVVRLLLRGRHGFKRYLPPNISVLLPLCI